MTTAAMKKYRARRAAVLRADVVYFLRFQTLDVVAGLALFAAVLLLLPILSAIF